MAPGRRTSTLLTILGLGCAVGTALPDVPSRDNFLRRVWAEATVLGNYVYIDGGELNQLVDGKSVSGESDVVNSTLSIDMSKSWKSTDVVIRSIPKPGPRKSDVGLWTDSAAGVFYSWGGRWPNARNMSKTALWKFTADGKGGGAWSLQEPDNPTLFSGLHATEYGAFTQTNDTGFIIGGVSHAWTELNHPSAEPIPGMATFDMKTKLWQNGTTNFSPFGAGTLNQGSAEYIAGFGEGGLIITLAGYAPVLGGNLNDSDGPPLDLRNLTFFNPQTKKRYWQVASGSIPPTPRGQTCTAVFPTADGGYDIFLFGGTNGRDKYNYQDTYILSLPGFVWTRAPDPPGGPRTGHTCVRVGNRQALSIGGSDNSRTDPDPAPQGLLLFDMTTLQWKDSYDANAAAYERTSDLKTWYGNGSLDKVEWSSDEVRKLFAATTSTNPNPSSTGSPLPNSTTDPASESGSTPVGAIVGGVVGGIGGLALIGVIAWFIIRRRRLQQQRLTAASTSNPNTYVPPGETHEAKYTGMPEADSSHGYTEMPARSEGFMHQPNGPVEMDPHVRPSELDATPTGWR